ncbi:GlsB/YeaQ/YmgE family stress response membrane protein [Catellatospora sp. NPDC049111]|uniref:GlsB/YeaQ/YmgE family stress response membrane protein n=1 Tax=Catellatospora sp. NPDC049111 TaxID=3155271 RepID=UPI00340EE1C4
MEITGIFTAVIIGLVIGVLGRLVLPGRQSIALWLTIVIGVVAALLGTFVAGAFDVANTGGVDWLELLFQIGFAALGVALVAPIASRSRID